MRPLHRLPQFACLLACLLVCLFGASCADSEPGDAPAEARRRPNVLLVTLDTTRADHLGCYGYYRDTSPHLDALAAEGVVYERATSVTSWTLPSHASLFTGKVPSSHGADLDPEGPLKLSDAIQGRAALATLRTRGLAPAEETLAERLADAGYDTAGFVAGPWLERVFGLDQGFAHWDDTGIETTRGRLGDDLTDAALAWLDQPRDAPFFLFLNYFDAHYPYGAPAPFLRSFLPRDWQPSREQTTEEMLALYDGEIRFADFHLGRVLQRLRDSGRDADTLIIVTADHGELFGEHDTVLHGSDLWQEELAIPLVVRFPASAAAADGSLPRGREPERVSLVDVLPLVLRVTGLPEAAGIQGALPRDADEPVLAELRTYPDASSEGEFRALFQGDLKLLWHSAGEAKLFDLDLDPGELDDLAQRDPETAARLAAELERLLAELPAPLGGGEGGGEQELDPELLRKLESLGYAR